MLRAPGRSTRPDRVECRPVRRRRPTASAGGSSGTPPRHDRRHGRPDNDGNPKRKASFPRRRCGSHEIVLARVRQHIGHGPSLPITKYCVPGARVTAISIPGSSVSLRDARRCVVPVPSRLPFPTLRTSLSSHQQRSATGGSTGTINLSDDDEDEVWRTRCRQSLTVRRQPAPAWGHIISVRNGSAKPAGQQGPRPI